MHIEARTNCMYITTPCVVCGTWDRPGDVAYYDENNDWVCDKCIEGGTELIQLQLQRGAEYYHSLANSYCERSLEDISITPPSREVLRELAELKAEYMREQMRSENTPDSPIPF